MKPTIGTMDNKNYKSYVNMNHKLIREIDVHAPEVGLTFENSFKAIKSKCKLKKKR
jgi:hypothetical protein